MNRKNHEHAEKLVYYSLGNLNLYFVLRSLRGFSHVYLEKISF